MLAAVEEISQAIKFPFTLSSFIHKALPHATIKF